MIEYRMIGLYSFRASEEEKGKILLANLGNEYFALEN